MTGGYVIRNMQGPLSSDAPTSQGFLVPDNRLSGVSFPVLVGAPYGTSETLHISAYIEDPEIAIWNQPVKVVSLGGGYQGASIGFESILDSGGRVLQLSFRPTKGSQSPLFLGSVGRQGPAVGPLRIGDADRFSDVQISLQLLQSSTLRSVASAWMRTSPHSVAVAIWLLAMLVGAILKVSSHVSVRRGFVIVDGVLIGLVSLFVVAIVTMKWLF